MDNAQPENTPVAAANRRTFLNRIWTLLGVLASIEVGWIGLSVFASRGKKQQSESAHQVINAGRINLLQPNTVTPISQGRFHLVCLEDGSLLALSNSCTHLGCAVPWDQAQGKFICPCHGSTFDIKGEVLTAPATRPLDVYPVRIENGMVKVDVTQRIKRDSFSPAQTVKL